MKERSELTILFVDDEQDILNSMKRFLRREPYRKLFAENGMKALELFAGNDISAIVSDLRMPEMNGLALISEVKKRNPDAMRLILSGTQDFDQIIDSINKGEVFRFIPKPVDPESFRTILNDALDYHCLKTEREELFNELSIKNTELTHANEALNLMAQELQRSEEKFRSMTDAAQDAVFMINHEGRIVYRNNAAELVFGFNRHENHDQRFLDIVSPEFQDLQFLDLGGYRSERVNGEESVMQVRGLRKDGSSVPIEISKGCVSIDSVPHMVLVARDITARVEAERSRLRYEGMQRELEADIEKKLLQSPFPSLLHGVSTSRMMMPSGHLDGDFTEFVVYNDHQVDILIGDVMGHGIQSALIGAGIKSLFLKVLAQKKYAQEEPPLLQDIVTGVHELCISELMDIGSFVTLLFLRLDLESGVCSMVDCGHPPLIHYKVSTGRCSMIKGENLPMGMTGEKDYRDVPLSIGKGDILVLYSDGITESGADEMFGDRRLAGLIEHHYDRSPDELIEILTSALVSFSGKADFNDDATCIIIRIDTLAERLEHASNTVPKGKKKEQ
ncbi:MAG: SpoIIE family protein phosphatase [Chlorobiaceae bacterium]|nr:SpoIIE family protein phosphatase [Chlorobiaceae bacterium]